MALGYLLDPTIQIQDDNGIPAAGAKIYIYEAGTTNPATTYRDFENHANTFPVLTDTLGNCTVIAYDGEYFDLVVNKADDSLLFSKKNISVNAGAGAVPTDVSVSAGYGIDVTYAPQYKRYTVGIDNDVFPSGGLFTYEPGRNIVFSASGSTKTVNLTNDVTIGNAKMNIAGFKYNDTQVNDSVKVGFSDMESSGFKVTDTSGNRAVMDTSDVKVYNNGTWYSLTAAMTGSPLSAGANIDITDNVISGKNWTNDITASITGKLDISATADWDITPYSAGRNVEINSNVIDVTGPNFYYGNNIVPTGTSAVNHGNTIIGENNYASPASAIGVNIIGSGNSAIPTSSVNYAVLLGKNNAASGSNSMDNVYAIGQDLRVDGSSQMKIGFSASCMTITPSSGIYANNKVTVNNKLSATDCIATSNGVNLSSCYMIVNNGTVGTATNTIYII